MDQSDRFVYLNGEILPENEALISPFDRGFLWGDGVYEVTPCFMGRPFRLEDHLKRLGRSLRFTQIRPPVGEAELKEITQQVMEANGETLGEHQVCKLGHWITRGRETVGMRAKDAGPSSLMVFCWPVTHNEVRSELYANGVRMSIVATRRNPPSAIEPRAKVTSKMNQVLAELDGDVHDAVPLMLDLHGNVTEGNISNFFMVVDGTILTSPTQTVLEGITRMTVLDYSEELDIPVLERHLSLYDLAQADEYFISQSTYFVLPVREIDRFHPSEPVPGPITSKLISHFAKETGVDLLPDA